MSSDRPILQVEGLRTHFFTRKGVVKAVDDVSFALRCGEIMGLVGESGAGKSITGFSILRLIDPPGRIVAGRILLDGEDLLAKSEAEMAAIRDERVGMVFQDPQTSLDPVLSIGYQIGEALAVHHPISRADGRRRAVGMLRRVGIPSPEDRLDSYPHQFSGGMRQRVVISIAMAGNPALLIADEPTTALDITIQAQILNLLMDLQEEFGLTHLFVSHDLSVVRHISSRVAVMYLGFLVETADTDAIFAEPLHPTLASSFPPFRRSIGWNFGRPPPTARFPRRSSFLPGAPSTRAARTPWSPAARTGPRPSPRAPGARWPAISIRRGDAEVLMLDRRLFRDDRFQRLPLSE
jgi:peptide/nickel transport system ATP-binding protein